jgi:energy-coupling factor transporter ATP-binding protein EcfA2
MITKLSAENFKSWEKTGEIHFAPLTGFFGANSSGKTSLLQVLLMLKQTVERPPDWNGTIDFGDESSLVNLGNFRDVIYKHRLDLSLAIHVSWNLPEKLTVANPLRENASPVETTTLSFSTSVVKLDRHSVILASFTYCTDEQQLSIEWRPGRDFPGLESTRVLLSGSPFRCYGVHDKSLFYPKLSFWQFEEPFENLFSSICYLGPRREYPRPHYTWEGGHPEGVGQQGRDMVWALLSAQIQLLNLDEQVPRWLRHLNLIDSYRLVPVSNIENGYEFLVKKHGGGPEVRLTDVGFGVSQILPVLTLCYYVPKGSILVLEQPEAHLHPNVQSKLADVLIDVVKNRNIQIILESHSEHLLHRLTRRIAEGEFPAKDTALYACQINDGTSDIEPLKMDEYGNVSNWPPDFFGDDAGDIFDRAKAENERRIANKS